jgi:hypothetical protein
MLLLLLACTPSESPQDSTVEASPTAHWMADVYADRPETTFGSILLPGAFNSTSYACDAAYGMSPDAPEVVRALWGDEETTGNEENRDLIVAWAKTQDRSIAQQLDDGIRFVEMNVTLKEGELTTWHSVYGLPLENILDELLAFAVAQPDEVILISFGLTLDSADWPQLADALARPRSGGVSVCDRIYDGTEPAALATLADIRSRQRNLIWTPSGELRDYLESRGDCPLSHGIADRSWSITVSPEGVEAALAASVAARDPEHLLINDFVFSLDGAASTGEQLSYLTGYHGVQEASKALGFAGDFPGQLIETYDVDGQMNIFAGAYYQDTTLIEAAIARNREP